MKLDLTKPYQMRDGRRASAVIGPDGRLYGWADQPGREACDAETWDASGRYHRGQIGDSAWDLVNIPEKRTVKGWHNVWPTHIGHSHPTRGSADSVATSDRIACIEREITYTVGEGLTPPHGNENT